MKKKKESWVSKVDRAHLTLKVLGVDIEKMHWIDRTNLVLFLIRLGEDDLDDMR